MNLYRVALSFPRAIALTGVIAALALSAPAVAAPMLFYGLDNSFMARADSDTALNAFVAAVGAGSISTQDFETSTLGDLAPVSSGTFANGVGVTVINTATDYLRIKDGIGAFDTYPTSGSRYLESLSNQGSTYFTATFDQAVRAIGFYVTDASDWACCGGQTIGKLKVVLTTAGGTTEFDLTQADPATLVDGNTAFFGVFDDANPFLSIAIHSSDNIPDEDAIGIDDVMISINAVPAPGTLGLLLGVLPVLGFLRRRK